MNVLVSTPPVAELAPFVRSIGYLAGRFAHARELALPSGTAQLLINLDRDQLSTNELSTSELTSGAGAGAGAGGGIRVGVRTSGAALQGARTRPAVIDPADQRAIIWVAFRPGGSYPFFPVPGAPLQDQLVDLADLWGRDGAVLRERLHAAGDPDTMLQVIQSVLIGRAHRTPVPDPAIRYATCALHRGATVATVADRLGWTTSRLNRAFTEHVGPTPKRYARVRRFQRTVRAAAGDRTPDWAGLAAEHGYHDQSHLIHEFRAFAGMTPTAYAPRGPAEPNHVPLTGGPGNR